MNKLADVNVKLLQKAILEIDYWLFKIVSKFDQAFCNYSRVII